MNNNFTVIIPLHDGSEEARKMVTEAFTSVPLDVNVFIVTSNEVAEQLSDMNVSSNIFVKAVDVENTDFCSLVNASVQLVETPYFSILEYDDVYTDIWFKNVEEYVKYQPETSVFLPLTRLTTHDEKKFAGFGNEPVWASSFSNDMGYIDNDCLQNFFNFYMTGSVFNKEDFKNCGGLKSSVKIYFWYEFLLRLTNKGKKVFVLPKIGYEHRVGRETSLYGQYAKSVTKKEADFYFDLAKKEYFFDVDRKRTYGEDAEEVEE